MRVEQRAGLCPDLELAAPRGRRPHERAQDGAESRTRDPDRDIVTEAHLAEDLRGLEGARDSAPRDDIGRKAVQLVAVEGKGAPAGRVVAGQDIEEGGLASAIGADESVNAARRHHERHLGEGGHTAESEAHVVYVENRPLTLPSPPMGERDAEVRAGRCL
ncbi:MAG: hypothetical protein DME16_14155 [Candidatus Rokuibacteriota bacterium]|nr:MAG: hypothetical protein DME16_14155 [Candidatus Rokubacteria bacterium]